MTDRYVRWLGVLVGCLLWAGCSGGEPDDSAPRQEAPAPAPAAAEPEPAPAADSAPAAAGEDSAAGAAVEDSAPVAAPEPDPVAERAAEAPEEPPVAAEPAAAAAPAVSADGLTLLGIVGGRNPAALIDHDGTQEMFRKGESVFGIGVVRDVTDDAVVLDAGGREVRLALPTVEAPEVPAALEPEPAAEIVSPTPIPGGELALVGIVGGRSPAALINYGGVQEMFRIGDEVFDKGRVRVVNPDSVVIAGPGGDVTLTLPVTEVAPEPTPEPAVVEAAQPSDPAAPTPPPVTRVISRAEATSGFARFAEILSQSGAEATQVGKTPGIRLGEIPSDSFLRVLGLKSGDVLQKIDGVALADPKSLPSLSDAGGGGSITVTCVRGEIGLTFTRPVR